MESFFWLGWIFAIALFTFGSTVEPTASFWDAGEYIATSAKLQIGHPPGAPFFQMMGAFFALCLPTHLKSIALNGQLYVCLSPVRSPFFFCFGR
jgi:hypothetical protein